MSTTTDTSTKPKPATVRLTEAEAKLVVHDGQIWDLQQRPAVTPEQSTALSSLAAIKANADRVPDLMTSLAELEPLGEELPALKAAVEALATRPVAEPLTEEQKETLRKVGVNESEIAALKARPALTGDQLRQLSSIADTAASLDALRTETNAKTAELVGHRTNDNAELARVARLRTELAEQVETFKASMASGQAVQDGRLDALETRTADYATVRTDARNAHSKANHVETSLDHAKKILEASTNANAAKIGGLETLTSGYAAVAENAAKGAALTSRVEAVEARPVLTERVVALESRPVVPDTSGRVKALEDAGFGAQIAAVKTEADKVPALVQKITALETSTEGIAEVKTQAGNVPRLEREIEALKARPVVDTALTAKVGTLTTEVEQLKARPVLVDLTPRVDALERRTIPADRSTEVATLQRDVAALRQEIANFREARRSATPGSLGHIYSSTDGDKLTFSWSEVDKATRYKVEYKVGDGNWFTHSSSQTGREASFARGGMNLSKRGGEKVTVKVTPLGRYRTSGTAREQSGYTPSLSTPYGVSGLRWEPVAGSDNRVTVTWDANTGGDLPQNYLVFTAPRGVKGGNNDQWTRTDTVAHPRNSVVVSLSDRNRPYAVRVIAQNIAGDSYENVVEPVYRRDHNKPGVQALHLQRDTVTPKTIPGVVGWEVQCTTSPYPIEVGASVWSGGRWEKAVGGKVGNRTGDNGGMIDLLAVPNLEWAANPNDEVKVMGVAYGVGTVETSADTTIKSVPPHPGIAWWCGVPVITPTVKPVTGPWVGYENGMFHLHFYDPQTGRWQETPGGPFVDLAYRVEAYKVTASGTKVGEASFTGWNNSSRAGNGASQGGNEDFSAGLSSFGSRQRVKMILHSNAAHSKPNTGLFSVIVIT